MEARVEASHLWHVTQPLLSRYDRRQVVGLMQWCQGRQTLDFGDHLVSNENWPAESCAAVHYSMANSRDMRPFVLRFQPRGEHMDCIMGIADLAVQISIDECLPTAISGEDPGRGRNSSDLAP